MNFRGGSDQRRVESVIDITSLVDIVFLLIIFLLVTTTFKDQEHVFLLDMATATHTDLVVRAERTTVYVNQKGELYFLEVPADRDPELPFDTEAAGQPISLPSLEARIRELAERRPDVELSIGAERGTDYQRVITLLDLCRKLGVQNVALPVDLIRDGAAGALQEESGGGATPPTKREEGDGPRSGTQDKR